MGSDPQFAKYPDLILAQNIFALANGPRTSQPSSLSYLQNAIKQHKMAPLYRHLAHPTEGVLNSVGESTAQPPVKPPTRRASLVSSNLLPPKKPVPAGVLPWDESLYEELKASNEQELEQFQKEEEEAEKEAGETEIQAARSKRAEFWARVGDKVGLKAPLVRFATLTGSRTKLLLHMRRSSTRRALWERRSTSSLPLFGSASSSMTRLSRRSRLTEPIFWLRVVVIGTEETA
jgi:hypothetical protein